MKWPFSKSKTVQEATISIQTSSSMLGTQDYPGMENSAFWGCMTKLCRLYATMPWKLYRDTGSWPKEVRGVHPILHLMNHPAPYLNSNAWRFIMGFQFELFGQAMAVIGRSGDDIIALYPVSPNLMSPEWKESRLFWRYTPTGDLFPSSDVLRFINTAISYDAVLSLADYSGKDLETIASSKTLQKNYYSNGASIGGVLSVPKGTKKEIKDQMAALLKGSFSGVGNSGKTLVIEDSMKYEPLKLNDGDISKLEAVQKWSKEEVYTRFFGPDSGATYANAEDRGIEEMKSVLPRFVIWETAFNEILGETDLYTKFNLNGLLRANSTTQMNCLVQGVNNGIYTINEARRLLDFPPVPGGDITRIPLNYGILKPDGSVENPNQTPTIPNPFDLPSDKKESQENLTEKQLKDRAYLTETQNVSKTSRSKIEVIMRRQVKDLVTKAKELASSGIPEAQILEQFEAYAHEVEKNYGNEYVEVFKKVINKLLPIVKKATGSKETPSQDALDAYAGKFGASMAGRFASNRVKEFKKAEPEERDELYGDWATKPAEDSTEETNRAGNAFQVFLFSQLHIEFMHVVAAPDACEFCQSLDGKVVEVNGTILRKGDSGSDGAGNTWTFTRSFKHPPFHGHCSCGVAPGK